MNVYSCIGKATCTMEYDRHLICKIRLKFALAFLIHGNSNTFECIALSCAPSVCYVHDRDQNREKDYTSGRAIDLLTAILSEIVDRKLGRKKEKWDVRQHSNIFDRSAPSILPHFSANSYHLFDIECWRPSTAPIPMHTHTQTHTQTRVQTGPGACKTWN